MAQFAKTQAVGVILTGIGADGARGIAAITAAGGYSLAQNESSCVVFGMPREAIKTGAVHRICPLQTLGDALLRHLRSSADA